MSLHLPAVFVLVAAHVGLAVVHIVLYASIAFLMCAHAVVVIVVLVAISGVDAVVVIDDTVRRLPIGAIGAIAVAVVVVVLALVVPGSLVAIVLVVYLIPGVILYLAQIPGMTAFVVTYSGRRCLVVVLAEVVEN